MIVICSPYPPPELGVRLRRLGVSFSHGDSDAITPLDPESSDRLFIVPIQDVESDRWDHVRARLWRANRTFIVAGSTLKTAQVVGASRDGADDVLALEDSDERWSQALTKCAASQQLWLELYRSSATNTEGILLGDSPSMRSLRQAVERLGPTGATVLILGQSGAGKERVAQALHEAGGGGPFLALNCAAFPKDLIESELFGAEKGAFTGSIKDRVGLVEQANGGTLFLDEIGEMEISLQPKILRFLETRQARRVGGNHEYKVNVRVISATNRLLDEEVNRGLFRPDLYYRISEVTLRVTPLSTRLEDVPVLAKSFLELSCERFGKHFDRIEPEIIAKFQSYQWPGNARELRSAIDRMVILFDGPVLRAQWWDVPVTAAAALPARPPAERRGYQPDDSVFSSLGLPAGSPSYLPNQQQKQAMAARLLQESDNNYSWVSAQLGINVTTLYRWRKSGKIS
jgi:DNA-binding NtrC family response regulator